LTIDGFIDDSRLGDCPIPLTIAALRDSRLAKSRLGIGDEERLSEPAVVRPILNRHFPDPPIANAPIPNRMAQSVNR
jgi:hypothetical protein